MPVYFNPAIYFTVKFYDLNHYDFINVDQNNKVQIYLKQIQNFYQI